MDYTMDSQQTDGGVDTSQESNATVTPAPASRHEILYFAYGSNLSSAQMLRRCPGATPVGLGYLHGWEWLINERGFANVVEVPRFRRRVVSPVGGSGGKGKGRVVDDDSDDDAMDEDDSDDDRSGAVGPREPIPDDDLPGVYGVLYLLPPEDEAALDRYEGVPTAYEKVVMEVEMVDEDEASDDDGDDEDADVVQALVYVDYGNVREGPPRSEYVGRMNVAVREARREWRLPSWYVESVIRRFIPAEE